MEKPTLLTHLKYTFYLCSLEKRREYFADLALQYSKESFDIIQGKIDFDFLTLEEQANLKANQNLARRCEKVANEKLIGLASARARDYTFYKKTIEDFLEDSKRTSGIIFRK